MPLENCDVYAVKINILVDNIMLGRYTNDLSANSSYRKETDQKWLTNPRRPSVVMMDFPSKELNFCVVSSSGLNK